MVTMLVTQELFNTGMCSRAVEHSVVAFFRAFLCCTLVGKANQRLGL